MPPPAPSGSSGNSGTPSRQMSKGYSLDRQCPDCGGLVSLRIDACPHCGCPTGARSPRRPGVLHAPTAANTCGFGVAALLGLGVIGHGDNLAV